ncbi:MAG: hypothetical protein ACQEQ4_04745 [Fibrobacterota bacterium]
MKCIVLTLLLLLSCSDSIDPRIARERLKQLCRDDLEYLVDNTASEGRRDDPYYDIVEITSYDNRSILKYKAVVDFYYLNLEPVNYKIKREYGFHIGKREWVRYSNEFKRID